MHASTAAKPPRRRRVRPILMLLLAVLALFAWRCERSLTRVVLNLSTARASAIAVTVLHQAAEKVLGEGIDYDQLMTVVRDDGGRVRLIQANTRLMNQLSAQVSLQAQQALEAMADQRVEVPLGAALGLTLLSGSGPRFKVSVLPVGTVSSAMEAAFQAAGINQTRHTILLRLQCTVRLVLPTGTQTVQTGTEIAIAESIIVGEVPSSYTSLTNEDQLNLAP